MRKDCQKMTLYHVKYDNLIHGLMFVSVDVEFNETSDVIYASSPVPWLAYRKRFPSTLPGVCFSKESALEYAINSHTESIAFYEKHIESHRIMLNKLMEFKEKESVKSS